MADGFRRNLMAVQEGRHGRLFDCTGNDHRRLKGSEPGNIRVPFRLCIFTGILVAWNLIRGCTAKIFVDSIQPNFTASNLRFVDDSGVFLASQKGTFHLKLHNPAMNDGFYLCVAHAESKAVVWSANRASPVAKSDEFKLTAEGASLQNSQGVTAWSARSSETVRRMQLRDDGNLVLLNARNASMWESFRYPTDTLLSGQPLKSGTKLVSSRSERDYSPGDYQLLMTESDLRLIWSGSDYEQVYWSMAQDSRAVRLGGYVNNNTSMAYALVDPAGLGLYMDSKRNSSSPVWQITGSWTASLRRAVVEPSGHLRVSSYDGGRWLTDFMAVEDECRLPAVCGAAGLCKSGSDLAGPAQCSCPRGLEAAEGAEGPGGCRIPGTADGYRDFDFNFCAADSASIEFLSVGDGRLDYFANKFASPVLAPSAEICEQLCARNCSCGAVFFRRDSRACFLLHDRIGSFASSADPQYYYAYLKLIRRDLGNRPSRLLLALLALLPVTAAGLGFACWRHRRTRIRCLGFCMPQILDPEWEDREVLRSIPGLPRRFSYGALRSATGNFTRRIGSGGFGSVYEGALPDGSRVAVKKLQSAGQGKKEFYSEIAIIGSIHHVNLVRLRGFCAEGRNRLLVYEFMNRGSLERSLFGRPVLEWHERLHIALSTARGLAYLHEGCRLKIIHCDIKPENILLDDKSNVKVCDFGLAKLLSREQSHVFTTMRGTCGYLAPEWLTGMAISDKSDVYSYGMLLLEIISGRKNYTDDHSTSDEPTTLSNNSYSYYFPAWALECYEQGRLMEIADPRLERRVSCEEIEKLVKIALCCVQEDPKLRPSMSKVVHMMEGNRPVEDPRLESLAFLRMFAAKFSAKSQGMDVPAVVQSDSGPVDPGSSSESLPSSRPYQTMSILSSVRLSGPR